VEEVSVEVVPAVVGWEVIALELAPVVIVSVRVAEREFPTRQGNLATT